MSSVGDLALSPGGLRVPARAWLFLQYFVRGLVFGFVAELGFHRDCAVTEREDAVHLGGASDRDFCRRLSRGSAFACGRILVEFEAVFQSFSFSLCTEPSRSA